MLITFQKQIHQIYASNVFMLERLQTEQIHFPMLMATDVELKKKQTVVRENQTRCFIIIIFLNCGEATFSVPYQTGHEIAC